MSSSSYRVLRSRLIYLVLYDVFLHLAPELFTTIRFTNEDNIAQSALAAVKAHVQHTTHIEFTPSAAGEDEFAFPALVPAVSELLQGQHTADARAAQIHFAFDFDHSDDWEEGHINTIYVFEDEEPQGEIEPKEQKYRWRALMTETWAALVENVHVTDLTWTSAFVTSEFRDFLGRLESATLRIWGPDNGAGWNSSTTEGYVEWLRDETTWVAPSSAT
ncbi:hypothetical protein PG996_013704 [Apiospora saccharicola]|uniref:Uncharacterized protein n=1 Tax=Apiospora saccharicola TaxID=335842 RepID=A0ABR1U670_9PEZI